MKIDIWSDVMCAFCYIGKRNFETAIAQVTVTHLSKEIALYQASNLHRLFCRLWKILFPNGGLNPEIKIEVSNEPNCSVDGVC